MDEDMSGRQLAEVIKFMAQRIQEGLDSGAQIVDQLKIVAQKLEEKRAQ